MKNLAGFILLLANLLAAAAFPSFASEKDIIYLKAEGVVNPVMSGYIGDALEEAKTIGAEAIIIELDTPGGLDLSMRDIVKATLASEVPVVVYVAPAGSRAASAGVFVTYAANVAAMAPGPNLRPPPPGSVGGDQGG